MAVATFGSDRRLGSSSGPPRPAILAAARLDGDRHFFRRGAVEGYSLPIRGGWIVVSQDDTDPEVVTDDIVRTFLKRFALLILPIAALVPLIGVLLARRLTLRMRAVSAIAATIGPRSFDTRLPLGLLPREAEPLAVATNAALDRLVEAGKIRNYGVSVERVEEALKAMEYPGVVSIQIIFNAFRQRPTERFFAIAKEKNVAIIARVPLASGLLSGKFKRDTQFESNDHRLFNRNGEAFDVGETFSGVPYEVGLDAVERIRPLVSGDTTMAKFALRWILMFDAVTVAIPGARNPAQARANAEAADLAPIAPGAKAEIKAIYDTAIRPYVHQRW
eukprot:gene25121-27146_t